MKKFEFRYLALQKKRKAILDSLKQELAAIEGKLNQLRQELSYIGVMKEKNHKKYVERNELNTDDLWLFDNFIRNSERQTKELQEKIKTVNTERAALVEKLSVAFKDLKIMEKLEEIQKEAHLKEAKNEESKQMDEIANQLYREHLDQ